MAGRAADRVSGRRRRGGRVSSGRRRGPRLKEALLQDLVCPLSRDPLKLDGGPADREDVDSGVLACEGCGMRWPIRGGIPRLVPPELVEQQQKTAHAFGWQWQHFAEMHPE